MITPIPLYNYLLGDEEYNKRYDELVKKEADWWEVDMNKYALNPTEEELQKTKEVMKFGHRDWKKMASIQRKYKYLLNNRSTKKEADLYLHTSIKKEAARLLDERKRTFTNEFVKDTHQRFFLFGAIAAGMGIKDFYETKRTETINKWKKQDKAKTKKLMDANPFENIKCLNCRKPMQYKYSMLMDTEFDKQEKVLFFYTCNNGCAKNQAIFADGSPWISKTNSNCAICQGNQESTTTKDNAGNYYVIYECKKCGSRQVEKINHAS